MKWNHDALANDLAAHLSGITDRMVWTDMQLGPSGSPRPDVFTAPKSYSKFMPIAYEVKISVADFRSDITSGKWQSYLKFASGVTFAVPAGLISKADLPRGCGLMIRGENGWTTVKAPTLSPVRDFPREAFVKLLIDGIERAKRPLPKDRCADTWKANASVRKKYGEELAQALATRDGAEFELQRQTVMIRERLERENKSYERDRLERKANSAREAASIDQVRAQLCEAIGIPADSDAWKIQQEAIKIMKALNRDLEIERLRGALTNVSNKLKWAVDAVNEETLPIFKDKQEQADKTATN